MNNHTCPVCGNKFKKKVYKKSQAVYCCQKCAYLGRSLGLTKRKITKPYNCKRKQPRICEVCQKEYIYNKSTQKYCSRGCFEISHKKRMIGKNNPAYKDGSSYLIRSWRGNDWDTLRLEIYKRDKFICQDCGIKCESKRDTKDTKKIIQCHHIEKYKIRKNNDKSNLITLCLKCHLKRHQKDKRKL